MNFSLPGKLLGVFGLEEYARSQFYRFSGGRFQKVFLGGKNACFYCRSPKIADYIATLNHEAEDIFAFLELLRSFDVFWDVGANMGVWSIFASLHLEQGGQVFAFEPMLKNVDAIRRSLRKNNIDNVTVCECALGAANCDMKFYPGIQDNLSTSSFVRRDEQYGTSTDPIIVKVKTAYASFLESGVLPTALKIDVEGSEWLVLQGVSEEMWGHIRVIALEVHHHLMPLIGGDGNSIRDLLLQKGFQIKVASSRKMTEHWLCTRA